MYMPTHLNMTLSLCSNLPPSVALVTAALATCSSSGVAITSLRSLNAFLIPETYAADAVIISPSVQ